MGQSVSSWPSGEETAVSVPFASWEWFAVTGAVIVLSIIVILWRRSQKRK